MSLEPQERTLVSAAAWGKGEAPDALSWSSVGLWGPGERDRPSCLKPGLPLRSLQLGLEKEQLSWVAEPSWLALS